MARGLHGQVGKDKFDVLCLLVDLNTAAAEAMREYITSDGQAAGLRVQLDTAACAVAQLRRVCGHRTQP